MKIQIFNFAYGANYFYKNIKNDRIMLIVIESLGVRREEKSEIGKYLMNLYIL